MVGSSARYSIFHNRKQGNLLCPCVHPMNFFIRFLQGCLLFIVVMKHAGKDQKIEMNENQVYGINTSQTPDDVIEMKANQVYGVSDALHGCGEIVMEKNTVYGGCNKPKEDYTENTEYDYISN